MLITTHSDVILQELSNLVMSYKAGVRGSVSLAPSRVSGYVFKFDRRKKAYFVEPLDVVAEEGFDDSEFAKVYEELHNRIIELRARLDQD